MINERFFDDGNFLPVGSPMPPPQTTGTLLARLNLVRTDVETQRSGIRSWLAENTPTPGLVRSLHRCGFGDLVADPRE